MSSVIIRISFLRTHRKDGPRRREKKPVTSEIREGKTYFSRALPSHYIIVKYIMKVLANGFVMRNKRQYTALGSRGAELHRQLEGKKGRRGGEIEKKKPFTA